MFEFLELRYSSELQIHRLGEFIEFVTLEMSDGRVLRVLCHEVGETV